VVVFGKKGGERLKQLTRDADKLFCLLYKRYLEQRKNGVQKEQAKNLGRSSSIKEYLNLSEPLSDVDETLRELDRAGFADNGYSDDTVDEVKLTDGAIIYMENRFKNGALGVAEFLSKFIP
jgi:hypothetical protein